MQFDEIHVDGHAIYTDAQQLPCGNFTARCVVQQWTGIENPPSTVFSDDGSASGRLFSRPQDALDHALGIGRQALRDRIRA